MGGGEAAVRPAEETSVPDWPVEDGLRQCPWLVQGRVALSLLARKEARIRVMLADRRDKISIAKTSMIIFREHSKRTNSCNASILMLKISTHPLNEGSQSFEEGSVSIERPGRFASVLRGHLGRGDNAIAASRG